MSSAQIRQSHFLLPNSSLCQHDVSGILTLTEGWWLIIAACGEIIYCFVWLSDCCWGWESITISPRGLAVLADSGWRDGFISHILYQRSPCVLSQADSKEENNKPPTINGGICLFAKWSWAKWLSREKMNWDDRATVTTQLVSTFVKFKHDSGVHGHPARQGRKSPRMKLHRCHENLFLISC